ncbi:uracil-DNA glycosylase [Hydrogenibacillus schlegelii]|uniref:Uracil-DNA glycosylase-like domain-containing protein n=1 Tax=Hydrogenibacillus schlegelii TaxID=1484 RepID=A0A179ITM7_HYDSH|nr:uracil-DNA glycosylase [Hydrogenibacillus schlegelii]OAR05222.1 hypothetical protein SA87_05505 [Hydrogenibacillus schlegelii]
MADAALPVDRAREEAVRRFVCFLSGIQTPPGLFNPWRDVDPAYDAHRRAPAVRRAHLFLYLLRRVPRVEWLWVGEALGYRGAHFSGVPFTSERMLLGHHPLIGPEAILGRRGRRTSRTDLSLIPGKISPATRAFGFAEVSATVVWRAVRENGLPPEAVLFFSAVPFHPYDVRKGTLSNRPPKRAEIERGRDVLAALLQLIERQRGGLPRLVAVGNVAEAQLRTLGLPYEKTAHPAQGNAGRFLAGMRRIVAAGAAKIDKER